MTEEIKSIIAAAYDQGRHDERDARMNHVSKPSFKTGAEYAEWVYKEIIEPAFKKNNISL